METNENWIKVDGEKDSFEGGAIRYSKKGKGRFDLIPSEVVYLIIGFGELKFAESKTITISMSDIIKDAYMEDDNRYINTIIDLVGYRWADSKNFDFDYMTTEVTYEQWIVGLSKMLRDLALHYEYGAEKYGVDNWKHGIPLTGGDRGGSFTDSGLRHLNQWVMGMDDEKHDISCIWNFVNATYLQLRNHRIETNKEIELLDEDAYDFGD